jgi:hypothetical protein
VFLGQKMHTQQAVIYKGSVTGVRKIHIFEITIFPIIDENNQCNEVKMEVEELELN